MLSWTYALKQEDSSLFTPHFPGKRQCYPGIDSQKDYKQGLHGVYDENEEEGIVCLNAIEYEHCLDGKMPRSGSVRIGTMTAMLPTMNVTRPHIRLRWEVASKHWKVR